MSGGLLDPREKVYRVPLHREGVRKLEVVVVLYCTFPLPVVTKPEPGVLIVRTYVCLFEIGSYVVIEADFINQIPNFNGRRMIKRERISEQSYYL